MIKIRLTYADDEEKDIAIEKIKESFEVLNISREYKGRGNSQYSNVYIDVDKVDVNLGDEVQSKITGAVGKVIEISEDRDIKVLEKNGFISIFSSENALIKRKKNNSIV